MGFHHREISRAKEFFKTQFPHLSSKPTLSTEVNKQVQTVLWEIFRLDDDIYQRAIAGLCLRCYVSHRIFITCKNIPHTYNVSAENLFRYTDLLPFVLNDDGKALVVLDSEGKTQHILNNRDGTTQAIAKGGEFFSVDILRRFNPNLGSNESLDNWTTRLTRQNEEIKLFLWEFGLATPSDWGLLCKSIPRSLSGLLSTEDYEIVKAFKTVYQRDRLKTRQKGRCSEPTPNQLQEMLYLLQQKNLIISQNTLIYHLKRIAENLRQDWLYKKTGSTKTVPMEVYDNSTNDYFPNPELPYHTDREPEDIVPEEVITSPKRVAHFYVLLEVLEEEEQLNIHGFLPYDQLLKYCQSINLDAKSNSCYQLPLSLFDPEVNNLLLYSRFLSPTAIPLPSVAEVNDTATQNLTQATSISTKALVNLTNWWLEVFEEGWQSTKNVLKTLDNNYVWGSARSHSRVNHYSGAKKLDFGLLLNGQTLALVLNLKRLENNEVDVLVQVIHCYEEHRNEEYLPPGLKLKVTLNPNTSESESQEVTAREADNVIQLEFSEALGKQFKVEISFKNVVVTEDFLL